MGCRSNSLCCCRERCPAGSPGEISPTGAAASATWDPLRADPSPVESTWRRGVLPEHTWEAGGSRGHAVSACTCLVLLDLCGDGVQDEAGRCGGAEELLCVSHPAQQLLHGAVKLGGDRQPLGQAFLWAERRH